MLDPSVAFTDIRQAQAALRAMHGRKTALDTMVDQVTPHTAAHVAEEALRRLTLGSGLWRFSGTDTGLLFRALEWLSSVSRKRVPK